MRRSCSSPATRASRAASPNTRTGRASSARCTSASTACAASRASSCRVLGTALVYQLSVVLTVALIFRTLDLAVPIAAIARVRPRGRDAPGAAALVRRPRRARRCARAVPAPARASSSAQAIAAACSGSRCTLIVSMLGAPAFAVGQREQNGDRLERSARREPDALEHRRTASTAHGRPRAPRRQHALLVGRDPRDPRLLLRVLRDPERERGAAPPHAFHNAKQHHPLEQHARHLPRGDAPGLGAALQAADHRRRTTSTARCTSSSRSAAGIFLFRKFSDDYPRYRNTLGDRDRARAHRVHAASRSCRRACCPRRYGFVDTLAKYPTFWSFNSGAVSKISNQYAAMPSVHIAWATWCALALVPRVKHRVGQGARGRAIRSSR